MSYNKSVGIDVGVGLRSLDHKINVANARIDGLGENSPYNPTNEDDWGCGCHDIETVKLALDYLAQFRASALEEIADLKDRVQALEDGVSPLSTDDGSSRSSFAFADIGREVIGLADNVDRGLVLDQRHKIISLTNRTTAVVEVTSGSGIIRFTHVGTQWSFA